MNAKLKLFLCLFVIPVMEKTLEAIEKEVEKTKTIWDDIALESTKSALRVLNEICKQGLT